MSWLRLNLKKLLWNIKRQISKGVYLSHQVQKTLKIQVRKSLGINFRGKVKYAENRAQKNSTVKILNQKLKIKEDKQVLSDSEKPRFT